MENKQETPSQAEMQPQVPPGDTIRAGNIGADAAVAQGRGAKALVIRVGNINLNLLPLVLVLLAAIGGMVYYFILMPKHPPQMTGRFNIAVAQFGVVDANGSPVSAEDGKKLADFVYQRINENFGGPGVDSKLEFQVWSPDYTGTVTGKDAAERAAAAQKLAEQINAHILIYGVVQQDNPDGEFSPEFYVSYKGFDAAQEITGPTELGSSLFINLPVDFRQQVGVENPPLAARTQALSMITLGLAYYSIDNFDQALKFFAEARDTPGWTRLDGKEMAYLLLGNAEIRQASKTLNAATVQQASQDYQAALKIKPNFLRAKLGLANAVYLSAFKDPANPSKETLDLPTLQQAEQQYQEALAQASLPGQRSIASKAHFGLGQVYQAYNLTSGEAAWLDKARQEYSRVIQDAKDDALVADLGGHSLANLGYMDAAAGDYQKALEEYKQAVELVSPHYQALYTAALAEIYNQIKETSQAVKSYQKAISLARSAGEDSLIEAYTERLSQINSGQ